MEVFKCSQMLWIIFLYLLVFIYFPSDFILCVVLHHILFLRTGVFVPKSISVLESSVPHRFLFPSASTFWTKFTRCPSCSNFHYVVSPLLCDSLKHGSYFLRTYMKKGKGMKMQRSTWKKKIAKMSRSPQQRKDKSRGTPYLQTWHSTRAVIFQYGDN